MKTAMKRLLSFVLVAMMLISVVPFQASATGETAEYEVMFDFAEGDDVTITVTDGTFVYLEDVPQESFGRVNAQKWWFTDGRLYIGEDLSLTAGVAFTNKDPNMSWTIKFTGDVSFETVKTTLPTVDEIKGILAEKLGADYATNYTIPADDKIDIPADGGEVTVSVTAQSKTVTVKVGEKTTTTQVKYNTNITLDEDLAPADSYDTWLYELAGVKVNGVDKSLDSSYTVTGDTTVEFTLGKTGRETTVLYVFDEDENDWVYHDTAKIETNGDVSYKAAPEKLNKEFVEFNSEKNGKGAKLEDNMKENKVHGAYYAQYNKSSDDGLSTLTVKAVMFVDGIKKPQYLTVYKKTLDEKTKVLSTLNNAEDQIKANLLDQTEDEYPDAEFKWDGDYYNQSFTDTLTSQSMTLEDGDKTVYIKAEATDSADVSLEIHTKISNSAAKTVWLKGYLEGDSVTRDEIIDQVKKYYSVSSKNIVMYTDGEWDDLVDNDKNAKTTEEIKVTDGVTKVHVLIKNYSSVNNSDNPKTGDAILMAVTVMGLSATALAAVYFVFKKKQSV